MHCNLYDSEWHLVRVKYSKTASRPAILITGCWRQRIGGGKSGKLRRLRHLHENFVSGKDPQMAAVADNLASLVLDARMEEEGFSHSSINPFLFPAE